jgi:four helix bundle protein
VAAISFQELEVWREAHSLVLNVYKITAEFPKSELFGLVSQMRRAAVSVPANIAEGFKRLGRLDKLRFYNIAEASLEELKYYIILSSDLGYAAKQPAMSQAESVGRLLYRFIQSVKFPPP